MSAIRVRAARNAGLHLKITHGARGPAAARRLARGGRKCPRVDLHRTASVSSSRSGCRLASVSSSSRPSRKTVWPTGAVVAAKRPPAPSRVSPARLRKTSRCRRGRSSRRATLGRWRGRIDDPTRESAQRYREDESDGRRDQQPIRLHAPSLRPSWFYAVLFGMIAVVCGGRSSVRPSGLSLAAYPAGNRRYGPVLLLR